jgi:hypothetical protein
MEITKKKKEAGEACIKNQISTLELAEEIRILLDCIGYKGTSHLYEQMRSQYIEPAKKKLELLIKNLS